MVLCVRLIIIVAASPVARNEGNSTNTFVFSFYFCIC